MNAYISENFAVYLQQLDPQQQLVMQMSMHALLSSRFPFLLTLQAEIILWKNT